jgi:amino acid transporter
MKKGFAGYATRFVDPCLGFATGWNYFFKYVILLPTNLTASGLIIQYWKPDLNVAIFVTVFGIGIVVLNVRKSHDSVIRSSAHIWHIALSRLNLRPRTILPSKHGPTMISAYLSA